MEGLDEPLLENEVTQYLEETYQKIVTESSSPDLALMHSINPTKAANMAAYIVMRVTVTSIMALVPD